MATIYRPTTLHRITGNPAEREHLLSRDAQGVPAPKDTDEARRLNAGVSMYATLEQARKKAQAFPFLGDHIACLEIPDDAPVQIERTLPGSRGHYTIWGDPDELLRYVVSIVPV